jgi:hypothetical protein
MSYVSYVCVLGTGGETYTEQLPVDDRSTAVTETTGTEAWRGWDEREPARLLAPQDHGTTWRP